MRLSQKTRKTPGTYASDLRSWLFAQQNSLLQAFLRSFCYSGETCDYLLTYTTIYRQANPLRLQSLLAKLRQVLTQVHDTVVTNMGANQKRQKDCYDRKAYGCRFKPDDLVWMINKKPDLLVNKFHDRWLGPFKVTKRCSDLVYEILDPNSGKTKRVHFNLLKAARRTEGQDDVRKYSKFMTPLKKVLKTNSHY